MRHFLWALVLAAVDAAAAPAAPQGDIVAERSSAVYAILFARAPKVPIADAARGCRDSVAIAHEELSTATHPPPPRGQLESFANGVSTEEIDGIGRSKVHWVMRVDEPRDVARIALRGAGELAGCLARASGGVIWDDETRQLFSIGEWKRRREDAWDGITPFVDEHITVHSYRQGEAVRSVTLGMAKLGLPDLVVQRHPASVTEDAQWLIKLAAQALLEDGRLGQGATLEVTLAGLASPVARAAAEKAAQRGAEGRTTLRLAEAKPDKGDAENRLLEIRFDGPEAHIEAIKLVFGIEDEVYYVHHDAELEAASRRAKEKLAALRPRFAKGVPDLERLTVKAPFSADEDTEWIWVELVSWQGEDIEGLIMNQPALVDLKQGAHRRDPERGQR